MKKLFTFFTIIFIFVLNTFAVSYKISNYEFSVEGAGFKFLGKTKEQALITKYPIDTNTEFQTEDDLLHYINEYKKQLESARAFDYVDISYETDLNNTEETESVILKFNIKDSHHLLILPYAKYDSNNGFEAKFKIKDSNFLGSLNKLSSDITLNLSNKGIEPGISFSYDYPFNVGKFNIEWVNDYNFSYVISNSSPEWDLKTGLKLVQPYESYSFVYEFYQYFFKNLEYEPYDDDLYFSEEISFSVPIILNKLKNFSNLYYTPKISLVTNWDFDGISKYNDYLSSPLVTIGHSLSNEKIFWDDCFRSGYSFTITNNYLYNIQRGDFSPYFELDAKFYYSYQLHDWPILDKFAINSNLYAFTYVDFPQNSFIYGNKIGSRLRGYLDKNYFGNELPLYTASSAIVLNIDLPHHLFTTTFSKDILNFNLQASPFFDMALVYDRNTDRLFSLKDGYYCAGLEFLVYPLKWASYTIRASYGVDLRGLINDDSGLLRGLWNNKELFIGIGLQY